MAVSYPEVLHNDLANLVTKDDLRQAIVELRREMRTVSGHARPYVNEAVEDFKRESVEFGRKYAEDLEKFAEIMHREHVIIRWQCVILYFLLLSMLVFG